MIKLPGLIDPHVHVREPGQTHKEDWDTATQAALAGGVTMILGMPNTKPPVYDAATLDIALDASKEKARCDYGQYLGAGIMSLGVKWKTSVSITICSLRACSSLTDG